MAGCSIAVVTMCGLSTPAASTTPFSAVLFASLPPLVKTSSSGEQPSSVASWSRARATAWAAGMPAQWVLEGLP